MSDFSSFALFTAGLALLARGASALDVVGGSNPTGPTLYTPSGVTAGKALDITWAGNNAACGKTVDLVLLKGPSSDKMAAISYIKQGVANTGSYSWTPETTLEPSTTDYGVEMVCSDNKAYQYTARFGIANAGYKAAPSSSSSAGGYGGYGSSTTAAPSSSASETGKSSTTEKGEKTTSTAKYPVGTATGGAGYANGTEPKPTGTMSVPTTIQTTATTAAATTAAAGSKTSSSSTAAASQTGAAGHVAAGFGGLAAAAAIAVYAL